MSDRHDPVYPTPNTKLHAEREAAARNARDGRNVWIVCDRRPSAGKRRWCVLRAPAVGDPVSRLVAGTCEADSVYQDAGRITKVERGHARVETDTGEVFWRQGLRACWKNAAGQSLVPGHGHGR